MTYAEAPRPRMRIIAAIDPAIQHTRYVLFATGTFEKWLCFGVIIFLERLFGTVNFRFSGGMGRDTFGIDPAKHINDGVEWVLANLPLVLSVFIAVVVISFVVGGLLTWLSSRGVIMLIRAVALNDKGIKTNWGASRRAGTSLFWFRLVLWAVGWIVGLALFVTVVLAVVSLAQANVHGWSPYVIRLLPFVVLAAVMGLILGLIETLLRNFVAPLMLHFDLTCMQAWRGFAALAKGNYARLLGFILLRLLYWLVYGVATTVVTCCTCCIGALPVIHHTVFAPFFVFDRAFSLFVLASLGDEYTIIRGPQPVSPIEPPPLPETP